MDTSPSQRAIVFVWLLCIIMFNSGMCSLKIRCNEKDKHNLLNFKQGVIDPSGVLSSWSTKQDCCHWTGVTCDNFTSRVTELSLPCFASLSPYTTNVDKSHCLTGYIHLPSLLEFEYLNVLDFSNNDFIAIQSDLVDSQNCHNLSVATPPRQCENSSALQYLDLSDNNNLNLNNLRMNNLHMNKLRMNNLQWLSRVPSLKYLDLSGIDLHKETNWLQLVTMLPSLSKLYLENCKLENLSPSLQYANFTTLEVLDLSDNLFDSELPNWLFNLTDISDIDLSQNLFRGQLPKMLLNLHNLKTLALSVNRFNGPIPDWLGQLKHLENLYLDNNLFSGPIPTNLGNLSSLFLLCIYSNPLTGVVSERNFAKLSNLKELVVASPTLNFDFDPHWAPPFQLDTLYFGPVGPKLPSWLYTQRSLRSLNIANSKFSFEAQDKFWNFVSGMIALGLKNNSIDGDLSGVLLNTSYIFLSSNNLRGGLPRLSSNVAVFQISNNSLSGSLSPLSCHKMNGKSNLRYLDISNNHLSGGLTDCWRNWKSLVHINLGSNNLTGKISPSMGFLSNLISLHLHENRFFGDIPPSLQNCHSLSILNVRENNFSGNIPNWMPDSAMVLQLRSNQFNGNIPPQICQMSSLTILDFGDNRISGHIPNCLYNITALYFNNASLNKLGFIFYIIDNYYLFDDYLLLLTKGQVSEYKSNLRFMRVVDLSSNDLSGTIPPQMFSLTGLHTLNLSHNQLMGRIPKEIGNMRELESLDFSTNQLSGEIPQSLSNLSFLGYLNLSFNNFTGKIPLGTQLQGFSTLSYIGNPDLCGLPLTKNCSQEGESNDTKQMNEVEDDSKFLSCFYIGMGFGFATGFWGVCAAIFFNRKWRHAYFRFLYDLRDRVYVMVVIKMNSFH